MIPSKEAKELIAKFYAITGSHSQAKKCALAAVDELIEYLQKNSRLTQCVIDLKCYEFVKIEIEAVEQPFA